jgi:hypothetical protein
MHPIVASTQDKSHICYDDPLNCDFRTCDQGSLNRHRQRKHGYMPSPTRRSRMKAKSSPSSSSFYSPDFFPSSLSLMQPQPPSFHYSPPPRDIPEPHMNGSLAHGSSWSRFGPAADPTPTRSHPGGPPQLCINTLITQRSSSTHNPPKISHLSLAPMVTCQPLPYRHICLQICHFRISITRLIIHRLINFIKITASGDYLLIFD